MPRGARRIASTRCCSTCCGSVPTNCCARVSTHTPRCPPPSSRLVSNSIPPRAGFVNGVLRTIAARDEQSWVDELAPPADTDPVGHVAFVHAHPRWIAQAFADALGADAGELDALLTSDDERPLVHLAARPGVLTAEELAEQVDGNRRPLLAIRGLPGRRRPRSARRDPGRRRAGAGRGQPVGGPGADAGRTGRRRRRSLARPLCRAGWQDGAVGGAHCRSARASPRSSPPRGAPNSSSRTPAACRSTCCESTAETRAIDPAASTECSSTRRAPGSARCGAGPRRAGAECPADVPALAKLQRELLASAIRLTRPGGVVLYATCSPHLVRDGRRRRRRAASSSRAPRWTPGRCSSPSTTSATGRTCSCGPTGTAPTRCSRPPSSRVRPWREPLIAPSILAADFARLADEVAAVTGADWLHVDVMDNHFVPNLTLGLPVVEALLKTTDIPMDCHLMIDNPDRWAPPYAEAGAYNVTFHAEATDNPVGVARDIRAAGAKAGLSVKPGTPIEPYLEILPRVRHPADHVGGAGFRRAEVHRRGAAEGRHRPPVGRRRRADDRGRDRRRHQRGHHRRRRRGRRGLLRRGFGGLQRGRSGRRRRVAAPPGRRGVQALCSL